MNEKEKFQFYYDLSQKLFRAMIYGIFVYPLYVAANETFHWQLFYFLNFETVKNLGVGFMVASIVFFPLSQMTEPYFVRGCRDVGTLGKKLMFAQIADLALAETITIFGLIIYITSGNLKFFYLFFIISFVHILAVRPVRSKWQERLDKVTH